MAELIKLGTILHMEKGKKPIAQAKDPLEGYLPYVDIKAFEHGIVDNYASVDKSLLCEDGDLLIVCDGSRSGLTGYAIKGVVGSTLSKISADGLNTKYLRYFIQSKYSLLNTRKKGTGTPHLDANILKESMIAVPSPLEQERIVSRIEELFSQLDASVAELKTAKERLKVYRQAVLKEAFSKYHTFTSLEQISERIFDGPFGSNLKTADYVEQGVRVVRLENLKNAWFDDTKRSFVTREKYQTISNHTVYPDDLIMSTFISEDIKICQLPKDAGFAVNKADCIGIRLKGGINPHFVMFYLSSREAYNSLIHQVHGATRPRVNTKQIKAMQIPVAELCEQDATVTEIEEKMSICDSIEKTVDTTLRQAEALRQSILKKAFEGGL